MSEREEDLFISPETRSQEAVTYQEREGRIYVSVAGIELEVYQGREGEVKPEDLEGRTAEEKAQVFREKSKSGTQYETADFENFILDKKSLEILSIFAKAIKLNQPCLMEGRHDIGKTAALEYLAYLTNHHLIYQPCSGQTDTLEFMGKYVPATESGQARFQQFLESRREIKPEAKNILDQLRKEGRYTLTLDESKRIAELEGILSPDEIEKGQWVWTDGTVGRAIHHDGGRGCWLYFDELGAVEPNVYIKLNPLLSRVKGLRRITITENATAPTLKAGPEFRLFATTNPPEGYQAREPFARDYLSRWVYCKLASMDEETFRGRIMADIRREVELPEEREVLALVFGELFVRFHRTAQQVIEACPWESKEQQFDYDDNRDRQRIWEYYKEFHGDDPVRSLKEAIEYCYLSKINPGKIINVEESDGSMGEISLRDRLLGLFDEIAGSGPVGLKIKERIEEILTQRSPEIRRQKFDQETEDLQSKTVDLPPEIQELIRQGADKLRSKL